MRWAIATGISVLALAAVLVVALMQKQPIEKALELGFWAGLVFFVIGIVVGHAGALLVEDAAAERAAKRREPEPPIAPTKEERQKA